MGFTAVRFIFLVDKFSRGSYFLKFYRILKFNVPGSAKTI